MMRSSTRQLFEHWFFEGAISKAAERNADGEYKYMPANQAWKAWQAAVKTKECIEQALKVIYTWADVDGALNPEHVRNLAGKALRMTANEAECGEKMKCDHKRRWHQIAGEGQFCEECGARNYDCND